jgi:hypothetical protein
MTIEHGQVKIVLFLSLGRGAYITYLMPGGKSKPIPPGTRLTSVYFFTKHKICDMMR